MTSGTSVCEAGTSAEPAEQCRVTRWLPAVLFDPACELIFGFMSPISPDNWRCQIAMRCLIVQLARVVLPIGLCYELIEHVNLRINQIGPTFTGNNYLGHGTHNSIYSHILPSIFPSGPTRIQTIIISLPLLMQPQYYNNNGPPPAPNPFNQPPHNPDIIVVRHISLDPLSGPCPVCNNRAPTVAVREVGTVQWLWCFGIFCLFWPLCWVPFCCEKCDDIRYECGHCRSVRMWYRAPCCP